ncbi:Flp family type IVb pilin [Terricaulis sp.]|uniref:Flp family type IVb pilin n=1 Tax=Terricaulis sp. TaxID=2768686 RepID=UPI00378402EC
MKNARLPFFANDEGTTAVEYAVIAGLIFLVIIAAIQPIGAQLADIFTGAADGFKQN